MLKPTQLKNGLTVIRSPKSGCSTFIIGLSVHTGYAIEKDTFPLGISKIIERLFWKGTDKHPSTRHLYTTLEQMGGKFFSHTSAELTEFYITVPAINQYKAVSFLAEVMQHSYFDPHDVEAEKKIMIDEVNQKDDHPELHIDELSLSNMYVKHAIGTPSCGSVESIKSIAPDTLFEYLSHQYTPKNCTLILSGGVDSKAKGIMDLVTQEWENWNPGSKQPLTVPDATPEEIGELPRIQYRQRGLGFTELSLGFLFDGGLKPQADNPEEELSEEDAKHHLLSDWSNLLVLSSLLGGGVSSRMWAKCVEDELIFNKLSTDLKLFTQTGYLDIYGIMENSQFTFGLESLMSVLDSLKKTTVSVNELTKAKSYIKGELILMSDDIFLYTRWLVRYVVHSGIQFTLEELLDAIDEVAAPTLRSISLDLFVSDRFVLTTLGPAKETRIVNKLIQKYLS